MSYYKPRFVSEAHLVELIDLYHLARVPCQTSKAYPRLLWAAKEFNKKYPAIPTTAAYKDLDAQMSWNSKLTN